MSKKILVTGATGYIGSAVAKALARNGFSVTGLVRSLDKGKDLLRHEVALLQGDLNKVNEFKDNLAQFSVIIDTVADFSNPKDPSQGNRALVEAALAARPHLRTSYVYTSGILVYADSPNQVLDESTPANNPLAARIKFEEWALQQDRLDGVILRPGFVYGHSGSFSGSFIPNADTITIRGNKERRWSWVHLDDLADAYVRVVQRFHLVKGQVFNIASEHSWSYEQIQLAVAKHLAFKGKIEYAPVGDSFFEQYANITVVISPVKAYDLLGWQPRKLAFWDDLETYIRAIKAHHEQQQHGASTSN